MNGIGFLAVLALALAAAGCSRLSGVSRPEAALPPATPAADHHAAPPPRQQPQPHATLRKKVVALLERKQYRQALEALGRRNREGLEREYALAMNGLLEQGDEAASRGDHGAAAQTYRLALDFYPEEAVRERIGRDQRQIRTQLSGSLSRLMEQGLQDYRRGRLESAIRIWKALLAVSPGDREARMALDTATLQLQNLKKGTQSRK